MIYKYIKPLVVCAFMLLMPVAACAATCPDGLYKPNGTDACELCPNDSYCTNGVRYDCPNKWQSPAGSDEVADCGRVLNYQPLGAAAPTQIYLRSERKTPKEPALAFGIGDHVFYANMTPVDKTIPGNLYVGYDNKTYHVHNDVPASVFQITTTPDTSEFIFNMSAAGTFYVDWGDGTVEEIVRTDTNDQQYSHTYTTADEYTIGFAGRATGYDSNSYTSDNIGDAIPAISFADNVNIAGILGSLGAIFPTIDDTILAGQPRFNNTFCDCSKLSGSIPENLFAGISGAPTEAMFLYTFFGCSGLSGSIPENLFAGISGAPAEYMFAATFYDCSGLSGSIPENLFAGIKGAPANSMFDNIFYGCSGLSGSIPENLFAGISGAPAEYMFAATFYGCSGLSGTIPFGLFGNLYGAPADYMFDVTFQNCSKLSGPTARMANGTRLYDVVNPASGKKWINEMPSAFTSMYLGTGINTSD